MGRLDAQFGWLPAPTEDTAPIRMQLVGSSCDLMSMAGVYLQSALWATPSVSSPGTS